MAALGPLALGDVVVDAIGAGCGMVRLVTIDAAKVGGVGVARGVDVACATSGA